MKFNRSTSHERFRLTIILVGLVALISLVVVTWVISLPLDAEMQSDRDSVPGEQIELIQAQEDGA